MYALLAEIDSLGKDHDEENSDADDQIVSTSSKQNDIFIIATTSQVDKVDKSLRRGGRLDLNIGLDQPTDNDRFLIFQEHLKTIQNDIETEDLKIIARAASGLACSDIAQIVRNSVMMAIKDAESGKGTDREAGVKREHLEAQILIHKPLNI